MTSDTILEINNVILDVESGNEKKSRFKNKKYLIFHVLATAIIIILNYLPIWLKYSYWRYTDDDNFIVNSNHNLQDVMYNSVKVKIALVISCMSILPFGYEILFSIAKKSDHFHYSSRIIVLLLLVPDLYMLVIGVPYKQFNFIHCLMSSRDTFFIYAFSHDLCVYCGSFSCDCIIVYNFRCYSELENYV